MRFQPSANALVSRAIETLLTMSDHEPKRDSGLPARHDAHFPSDYRSHDDEISLLDLWLVLHRRRLLILAVFLFCVALGVVYWLIQQPAERYFTAIELGRVVDTAEDGADVRSIEGRETVLSRLRDSALPLIRRELAAEYEVPVSDIPRVSLRVSDTDDAGGFVFLESQAVEEKSELAQRLHRELVDFLLNHHQERLSISYADWLSGLNDMRRELAALSDERIFRLRELGATAKVEEVRAQLEAERQRHPITRREREAEVARLEDSLQAARDEFIVTEQQLRHSIRRAEAHVEALAEQQQNLQDQRDRLAVEETLLAGDIEDLDQWLGQSRQQQQNLTSRGQQETVAMSALLMGNFAEDVRQQLSTARQQLQVDLPARRAQLTTDLAENAREQRAAQEEVAELRTMLSKHREDHQRVLREGELQLTALRDGLKLLDSDHEQRIEALEREQAHYEAERTRLFADYEYELEAMREAIARYEAQGRRMTRTEATVVAVPVERIGRGGSLILALSAVLGLMLGVFSAFFAEFNASAKERLRAEA